MSARFLAPDLTQLAPAALIDEVSFENILADQKAWVLARWQEVRAIRPDLPPLDTLGLETEPMTMILEAYAYRETLVRATINDKARAVLLAYATGTDLDHVGALLDTSRMADPAAPSGMESDERFRRRIQLAPEAFSTCGPRGAYIYFALTEDISISDAWAYTPDAATGRVNVVVAGRNGATISDDVLNALVRRYAKEDVVPLTDAVSVYRAARTDYSVAITALLPRGPDPAIVKTACEAAVRSYALERYRVGSTVFHNGLVAAAKVGGIENLTVDCGDVTCDDDHIPFLTAVNATMIVLE